VFAQRVQLPRYLLLKNGAIFGLAQKLERNGGKRCQREDDDEFREHRVVLPPRTRHKKG
jgi:hypothetical protein